MSNKDAYNEWAASYDEVDNPTRDLEMQAKKSILQQITFANALELGCGTGKNTSWLKDQCESVTAVDFSENMIAIAKKKNSDQRVTFITADINAPWQFLQQQADLVTCSLVLEHIENLENIFRNVEAALVSGGYFYIGELHPFKQYSGSKARFQQGASTTVLDCYIHHITDFTTIAANCNLELLQLNEWFDDDNKPNIPRIITFLFRKQ